MGCGNCAVAPTLGLSHLCWVMPGILPWQMGPIARPFRPLLQKLTKIAAVWRENDTHGKKAIGLIKANRRGARNLPEKAKIWRDAGAARAESRERRAPLCDPETRGAATPLRSATGTRRRHEELGGHPRPEPRSQREAPCGPCRGPSGRIQHLRRHDPERRVWRRDRDDLGSRHLASRRRPAQGLGQGPPRV